MNDSTLDYLWRKHDDIVIELRTLGFECEDRTGYKLPEISLIEDEANHFISANKIKNVDELYKLIGKLDVLQDILTDLKK